MIKVYYANIELFDEPELFDKCLKYVHPIRMEKVLRCKREADRKRSLLAGVLLKIAFEREGYSYDTLDFAVEVHGRPVVKNVNKFFFSLSHAGNYALCCMSDQPVGADIEVAEKKVLNREKQMQAMAKKALSEAEYKHYHLADAQKKTEVFLKYWTRKESYSKAFGEGLRMDFSSIDTEAMGSSFWSDWLEEDCFVSIYAGQECSSGIEFEKIFEIK